MRKANAKEIYAASLIFLIGIIYLGAQADALFSIRSTTIKGDVVQVSKNEMLSHLRSILTIVLCFTGGILLLKMKKPGWIISQAVLLLLLTIASGIFISNMTGVDAASIILSAGIFLLLLAIVFLLQKQTRQRFMISKKSYLPVGVLFSILIIFYFLLQ